VCLRLLPYPPATEPHSPPLCLSLGCGRSSSRLVEHDSHSLPQSAVCNARPAITAAPAARPQHPLATLAGPHRDHASWSEPLPPCRKLLDTKLRTG
jgi:hypothetical protein